jgi:hypothetical protein
MGSLDWIAVGLIVFALCVVLYVAIKGTEDPRGSSPPRERPPAPPRPPAMRKNPWVEYTSWSEIRAHLDRIDQLLTEYEKLNRSSK